MNHKPEPNRINLRIQQSVGYRIEQATCSLWRIMLNDKMVTTFHWNDFKRKLPNPTLLDCAQQLPNYHCDIGHALGAINSLNVHPQDFHQVVNAVIGHRNFWSYTPEQICECIMRYEECHKCGMSLWECERSECKGGI